MNCRNDIFCIIIFLHGHIWDWSSVENNNNNNNFFDQILVPFKELERPLCGGAASDETPIATDVLLIRID